MADPIAEFLVSIGFATDTAEQAKVEATVKATEAKITAAPEAETAERAGL